MSGNHVEQQCGIADGFGKWSDLIERRREGDQAKTRNAAVGGFHADTAAQRGGLPNRAAGIRTQRRERFILFVDDLSFEEGETQYKTLKAVLEGSLEARPKNVLIYASSNRRHLIQEYFSDRNDLGNGEVRQQDTLQEKVSLADRFGIQLVFVTPNQREYFAIVTSLAKRRQLPIGQEDLERKALQWVQLHNARSGRTARQFIDDLTAELSAQAHEKGAL